MNICVFCGGDFKKEIVTIVKERNKKVIIIEKVPAGVCKQCGEKEYDASVAKRLETILRDFRPIVKEQNVPVADFSLV